MIGIHTWHTRFGSVVFGDAGRLLYTVCATLTDKSGFEAWWVLRDLRSYFEYTEN